MYEIALTVAACLRADTRVDVAWAVQTEGIRPVDLNGALALTPEPDPPAPVLPTCFACRGAGCPVCAGVGVAALDRHAAAVVAAA